MSRVEPCLGLAVCLVLASGAVQAHATDDPPVEAPATADAPPAGPEITGVWGARDEGSAIQILGRGFGSHTLDIDSGVGPNGWIESTPAGTPIGRAPAADHWTTFATKVAPYVDTDRAHSGKQSVNASVDRGRDDDWNKILVYTGDQGFSSIYATWWVYFVPLKYADNTQWKMWRVSDDGGSITASDNCASLYQNSRWSPSRDPSTYVTELQCMYGCEWPAQVDCYAKIQPEPFYPPLEESPFNYRYHSKGGTESFKDNLPLPGHWCRSEVYLKASDYGVSNGQYWFSIHRPGEPRKVVENWVTGVMTHNQSCCSDGTSQWKHFVLQGYWDDDGGPFMDEEAEFHYDDIYLQFGTQARVEMGDRETYDACTQLEVQTPQSWSDGEIGVSLNYGAFQPGERVWLFVIDGEGKASNGMPARLIGEDR